MQGMKTSRICTSIMESNIDRLSGLHDDIILRILSLVDIKTAIHTCMLSKRWRNLWTALPHLDFNSEHFNNLASFRKFVLKVLSRCESNGLISLRFCQTSRDRFFTSRNRFFRSRDRFFTSRVLRYAGSHGVEEVSLLHQHRLHMIDFFSSCKSLRTLKLENCILPEKCCLSSLSCCVNLETLKIIACLVDCGKTMKISAPRLAKLDMAGVMNRAPWRNFELFLSAPKLSTFFYCGVYPLRLSMEGCSTLYKVGMSLHVSFENLHANPQELYSHVKNLLHSISFCSNIVDIDLGCWRAISVISRRLVGSIIYEESKRAAYFFIWNLQKHLLKQTEKEKIDFVMAISELSGLLKSISTTLDGKDQD